MSADGLVSMIGKGEYAVHNHPGPPALIGSATFEIHNRRAYRDTPDGAPRAGTNDWIRLADLRWIREGAR